MCTCVLRAHCIIWLHDIISVFKTNVTTIQITCKIIYKIALWTNNIITMIAWMFLCFSFTSSLHIWCKQLVNQAEQSALNSKQSPPLLFQGNPTRGLITSVDSPNWHYWHKSGREHAVRLLIYLFCLTCPIKFTWGYKPGA